MNELDPQNDKYWKGGMIYNNPKDPDIWVSKRPGLGWGWTLNFAHSASYLIIGTILLVAAVPVIYSILRR